ncbi:MAG: hypothetical protein ACE5IZ_06415 [Dehalococcoidia bacterium]
MRPLIKLLALLLAIPIWILFDLPRNLLDLVKNRNLSVDERLHLLAYRTAQTLDKGPEPFENLDAQGDVLLLSYVAACKLAPDLKWADWCGLVLLYGQVVFFGGRLPRGEILSIATRLPVRTVFEVPFLKKLQEVLSAGEELQEVLSADEERRESAVAEVVEDATEVELPVPEDAEELPEWQRKLLRLKESVAEEGKQEEGEQ